MNHGGTLGTVNAVPLVGVREAILAHPAGVRQPDAGSLVAARDATKDRTAGAGVDTAAVIMGHDVLIHTAVEAGTHGESENRCVNGIAAPAGDNAVSDRNGLVRSGGADAIQ